jgi:hypothetical protein
MSSNDMPMAQRKGQHTDILQTDLLLGILNGDRGITETS